jgi:cytochrome P450
VATRSSASPSPPAMRLPRRSGFPAGPDLLGSWRWLTRFFDEPVDWYGELRAQYGDLVGLRVGGVRLVVCSDLDVVEQIMVGNPHNFEKGRGIELTKFVLGEGLFTTDNESNRRHRKLAAPVFTPRTIEPFAAKTVAITRELLATWGDGEVVAAARGAYEVSLRVAGVGLFGTDFSADERAQLHHAVSAIGDGYRSLVQPGGTFLLDHGLTPAGRRMRAANEHIEQVVRGIITTQREAGAELDASSLIARLIAARDDETAGGLDDQQLRDEAVTYLIAGHDTVAATLAWCFVLLGMHPAEQALVRTELDEVLGGAAARAVDLRALPRLHAFIEETLRLEPSIYSTVRTPIESVVLPGGQVLAPGTDVIVPIGAIHRDPRHWSDPLVFRPERFLDRAAVKARHRMACIPFGMGPRVCIGASFAMQELMLVLATVLQAVELSAPDGWMPTAHVGFLRRPAGEVPLRITHRRGAGA